MHVTVVAYDYQRVGGTWEMVSCNPEVATLFVAYSNILISHQPEEMIRWQRQCDQGPRP